MNREKLTKKVEKEFQKFIKKQDEIVFCKLSFLNTKTNVLSSICFDGEEFKEEE
jgi:hypothetical protein